MNLVVEDYMSKVIDDNTAPLNRRVLPEFELHSRIVSTNDSRTLVQLRKAQKSLGAIEISKGVFKHIQTTHCGVHGYQLVYLDNTGLTDK